MNIYVLGDSISIHYGPALEHALRGIAGYARKGGEAEALRNLDQAQGANCGDSGMVLAFLREKAAAGGINADWLLLNCGLHDIKIDPAVGQRQVSPEAYAANLRAALQAARAMGLAVAWVRTTPIDERLHRERMDMFLRREADVDAYNAAADAVMAEAGAPVADLHAFTLGLGEDLYCDHVHFHEWVRARQADFLAGFVNALRCFHPA